MLSRVYSLLEENDEVYEIAMLPPRERPDAETNCDSGESDDKNEGLIHHLPRCLLNSCFITTSNNDTGDAFFIEELANVDIPGPSKQPVSERYPWKKGGGKTKTASKKQKWKKVE